LINDKGLKELLDILYNNPCFLLGIRARKPAIYANIWALRDFWEVMT